MKAHIAVDAATENGTLSFLLVEKLRVSDIKSAVDFLIYLFYFKILPRRMFAAIQFIGLTHLSCRQYAATYMNKMDSTRYASVNLVQQPVQTVHHEQ